MNRSTMTSLLVSGGLLHSEIMVACKNVGIDMNCDACAATFYTGSAQLEKHTCGKGDRAVIVDTDNFGSDYPNESLLLFPMSRTNAQRIANVLNNDAGENASRFYKVEEVSYVLRPGFEP